MTDFARSHAVLLSALLVVGTACSQDAVTSSTTATSPAPSESTVTTTSVAPATTRTVTTTTISQTTTTSEAGPIEFVVTYSDGTVTGGGRLEVPLGETVQITVDTDTADEAHLHGYDIFADVEPGVPGVIDFIAEIPGIFEFELESSGVLLAELEVAP